MKLDTLNVSNLRNLKDLSLSLSPSVNLVYGENGSGKSSILEAIHLLGYGRSFRTSQPKHIIQNGCDRFTVFTQCSDKDKTQRKIGLQRSQSETFECSIDGERSKKIADLASLFPVQIFTPQSVDLLLAGPSLRRKFIDWGLFHVEHHFHRLSSHYKRAVSQRNALLKQLKSSAQTRANKVGPQDELFKQDDYWVGQIANFSQQLNNHRTQYLARLKPYFNALVEQFLPEFSIEISYYEGCDTSREILELLQEKRINDIRFGFTSVGAHKADLKIKADNKTAVEMLSRGQLRMLVAALQLAQSKILFDVKQQGGIFLLDDIGAELDEKKRSLFISELLKSDAQLFITAIDKSQFSLTKEIDNKKMFHVEHGHVTEE
ncbi:DNA replication/repair protein RecF [Alteromonas flava]|uniref:DNA replication/repair protein RecF n=1 Tax=Alteromonas flava TaxID=2048003 RepID=UPI000C288A3B|nr:DNA replication/repair protein RecF [Alteromonas flava]